LDLPAQQRREAGGVQQVLRAAETGVVAQQRERAAHRGRGHRRTSWGGRRRGGGGLRRRRGGLLRGRAGPRRGARLGAALRDEPARVAGAGGGGELGGGAVP